MLVTIVALFVLCWLPLQTFLVVLNYSEVVDHNTLNLTFFICHWIAMSNNFVNPIVYGTLNDSFRADAKNIFCRCLGSNQPKPSSSRHKAVKFRRAKSFNTYGKKKHKMPAATALQGHGFKDIHDMNNGNGTSTVMVILKCSAISE